MERMQPPDPKIGSQTTPKTTHSNPGQPTLETPQKSWVGWVVSSVMVNPFLWVCRKVGLVATPQKPITGARLSEAPVEKSMRKKGRGNRRTKENKSTVQPFLDSQQLGASVNLTTRNQSKFKGGLRRQGVSAEDAALRSKKEITLKPLETIESSLPADLLGQPGPASLPLEPIAEEPPPSAKKENSEVDSSRVAAVGFNNPRGGSCFANANLKALIAAYPDSYFEHLHETKLRGKREPVRAAFVELLAIARGRDTRSNPNVVLRKLFTACHNLSAGEAEGFSGMFSAAGGGIASDGRDFLDYLMEVLKVKTLRSASVTPAKHWQFRIEKESGETLEFVRKQKLSSDTGECIGLFPLNVRIGDEHQSVQSCIDQVLAPASMPGVTMNFKREELAAAGYQVGDSFLIDMMLEEGQGSTALPAEKEQQALLVDIQRFDRFGVSLKLTKSTATGGERLEKEAQAIRRNMDEELTLPVTDTSSGQKFLVNMRLKSVSYHDGGHYSAGVREENSKWRRHDDSRVDGMFDHPSEIGDPCILFYERVGDPVPVGVTGGELLSTGITPPNTPFSDTDSDSSSDVSDTTSVTSDNSSIDCSEEVILESHCDLSISTPEDEVAEINRALYRTLADLSITGKKLPYDRRQESESARMLGGRAETIPLLSDVNQFCRLFSGVPLVSRKDTRKMAQALVHFRKMSDLKDHDPHPQWQAISPEYFPHLLMRGHLDSDLTSRRPGDSESSAFNRVLAAEGNIAQNVDFPVQDYTVQALASKGIVPHDAGLYNFCQNCYMNASMQMMAFSLFNVPEEMARLKSGTIPLNVAKDLVEREYPSVRALTEEERALGKVEKGELEQRLSSERNQKIEDAARDAVAGQGEYAERFNHFEEYYEFRNSFIELMEVLNTGEYCPEVNELQKQFFKSYLTFADQAGLFVSQSFFGEDVTADNLVPQRMEQMDASEFINEMCLLLGWKNSPETALHVNSSFELEYNGDVVYRKPANIHGVRETAALVNIPLKDVDLETLTLQSVIDYFLTPEPTEEGVDAYSGWTEEDFDASKIPQEERSRARTNKVAELKCIGTEPPRNMMLGVKPFEYIDGGMVSRTRLDGKVVEEYVPGKMVKLKEHSLALLNSIDEQQIVELPLTLDTDPEASVAPRAMMIRKYKLNSIVMHKGDSPSAGHYETIRFEGDQAYICDDEKVLTVTDYCKYHDINPAFATWQEYCAHNDLRPYVFSLQDATLEQIPPPVTRAKLSDISAPMQQSAVEWCHKIASPLSAPAPVTLDGITLVSGDITRLKDQWGIEVDAVTNAANQRLQPGSGVCGAIFKAAGSGKKKLEMDCRQLDGCLPGRARITGAYDLKCQGVSHIIHAVGPDMRQQARYGDNPQLAKEELKSAYKSAMVEAHAAGLKSIAMPALSVGVFQYPAQGAMQVAAQAVREYQHQYADAPQVVFVLYHDGQPDSQMVQSGQSLRNSLDAELRQEFIGESGQLMKAAGFADSGMITHQSAPPILFSELDDDSPYVAIDLVARTNHQLYKALSEAPFKPQGNEREGWYAYGKRIAFSNDNFQPSARLVSGKREFRRLFDSVPLGQRMKPEQMIHALRDFKRLQQAGVKLSDSIFPVLMQHGKLNTESLGARPDNYVDRAETILTWLKQQPGFPVIDPNQRAYHSAASFSLLPGFESPEVSNSLKCALQVLLPYTQTEEQLIALKQNPMPLPLAEQMMAAEMGDQLPKNIDSRQQALDLAVSKALARNAEQGQKHPAFKTYDAFKDAYIDLAEELVIESPDERLRDKLEHFHDCLNDLCEELGKPLPVAMDETPAVMVELLAGLLGWDDDEGHCLQVVEQTIQVKGLSVTKDSRTLQGASLAMPLSFRRSEDPEETRLMPPSLQKSVLDFVEPQTDMGSTRPDVSLTMSLTGSLASTMKTKATALRCVGELPPEHIVLNLQDPWNIGKGGENDTRYKMLNKISMTNTDEAKPVTVPLKNQSDQVAAVKYRIQSVVCQRPSEQGNGHHLTLRFDNGHVLICDDGAEVKLQDFVGYDGKKHAYANWQDFCVDQGLLPCSVALHVDEDPAKVQWVQEEYPAFVEQVKQGHLEELKQAELSQIETQRLHDVQRLRAVAEARPKTKVEPLVIELEMPVATGRVDKPGFRNHGQTCYLNSSLVCLVDGLGDEQIDGLVTRMDAFRSDEAKYLAKGFINLARAYKAGASNEDIDRHLSAFLKACHFMGQAELRMEKENKHIRSEADAMQLSLTKSLMEKTQMGNLAFANFFKTAKGGNVGQQDAHEFLNVLMDTLGFANDPSCVFNLADEIAVTIGGVNLIRTRGVPQSEVIFQLPMDQYIQGELKSPKTLQGCFDNVLRPRVMEAEEAMKWYLDDVKETSAYLEAKERGDNIDHHFTGMDGNGAYAVPETTETCQIQADLSQLRNVLVQNVIFDSYGRKLTARCSTLKSCFTEQISVQMRHTDGQLYDVVLAPVSISSHSGATPHSGHYIGYSDQPEGEWIRHDDHRVSKVGDMNREGSDPYLVNYRVLGVSKADAYDLGVEQDEFEDALSITDYIKGVGWPNEDGFYDPPEKPTQ